MKYFVHPSVAWKAMVFMLLHKEKNLTREEINNLDTGDIIMLWQADPLGGWIGKRIQLLRHDAEDVVNYHSRMHGKPQWKPWREYETINIDNGEHGKLLIGNAVSYDDCCIELLYSDAPRYARGCGEADV